MSLPTADNHPVADAPFSAATSRQSPLPAPVQPIDAWIDLMEVVEMLCPVWPMAAPAGGGDYRL